MGWYFNGNGAYVRTPPNQIATTGFLMGGTFSVEMWVLFYNTGKDQYLLERNNGVGTPFINLLLKSNRRSRLLIDFGATGGSFFCDGVTQLQTAEWHYMTATALFAGAGNELNIFVDNEIECRVFSDGQVLPEALTDYMHVGALKGASSYYAGYIYYFHLWNIIRSYDNHFGMITNTGCTGPYTCNWCLKIPGSCLPDNDCNAPGMYPNGAGGCLGCTGGCSSCISPGDTCW